MTQTTEEKLAILREACEARDVVRFTHTAQRDGIERLRIVQAVALSESSAYLHATPLDGIGDPPNFIISNITELSSWGRDRAELERLRGVVATANTMLANDASKDDGLRAALATEQERFRLACRNHDALADEITAMQARLAAANRVLDKQTIFINQQACELSAFRADQDCWKRVARIMCETDSEPNAADALAECDRLTAELATLRSQVAEFNRTCRLCGDTSQCEGQCQALVKAQAELAAVRAERDAAQTDLLKKCEENKGIYQRLLDNAHRSAAVADALGRLSDEIEAVGRGKRWVWSTEDDEPTADKAPASGGGEANDDMESLLRRWVSAVDASRSVKPSEFALCVHGLAGETRIVLSRTPSGLPVVPVSVAESTIGPEPGAPIGKTGCPCCGAALTIEHGDDEGEIAVLSTCKGASLCPHDLAPLVEADNALGQAESLRDERFSTESLSINEIGYLNEGIRDATDAVIVAVRALLASSRGAEALCGVPIDPDGGRGCNQPLPCSLHPITGLPPEGAGFEDVTACDALLDMTNGERCRNPWPCALHGGST